MLNRYLDLNFEVIGNADNSRYANSNDIRLVISGPLALFSNFILTTSIGKLLEDNSHAHLVSLMYKLLTSSRGSDDLSLGFHRRRAVRRDDLALNKNKKSEYHLRIMLKDVFAIAECQKIVHMV